MDINDISRMLDQQDVQVLSPEAARNLLMDKSNPKTSESLACAAKLDYMLEGFIMGSNSINEVRTSAENLLESVDDDLGLIYAIIRSTKTISEPVVESLNEVSLIGSMKFVNAIHNMMEQMRGYLSGRCEGEVLAEMCLQISQLCENAHRNALIIEDHHGSNFFMSHTTSPRPDAFDRILVETVSSGAIGAGVAIRPAILGSKKGPKDVFAPKKKNRWYLKYAIE